MSIFQTILRYIDGLPLGLLEHKADERDLSYDDIVLGNAPYKPKHRTHTVDPKPAVKSQQPYNTCCFMSAVSQKEIEEGKLLSARSLVTFARARGRLEKDGYSTLRNALQTVIDDGVAEASALSDEPMNSFETYASAKNITPALRANAKQSKGLRYFSVSGMNAWMRALDDGYAIQTWMDWRTAYNMSGGLRPPYVLDIGRGISVGGHAFVCTGYDMDKGLLKFKNSFGLMYGDRGHFYVRMTDWFNRVKSVGYVLLDVDNSRIAGGYNGKDVKADGKPDIYRIEDGKKRWYPSEAVFYKHGGRFGSDKTWTLISSSILDSIPQGTNMA